MANPIVVAIRIVKIAAIVLLALPIAFVITIITFPLWRWIDLNTSVEAFGHSGPAEWCFYLVYGILVVAFFSIWSFRRHGSTGK